MNNTHPRIKDLPEDERPRERFLKLGESFLPDSDLLAIIIRDGTRNETAVDLAKKLLAHYGSLRGISSAGIKEICTIKGIGPAKASQIKAALELSRRMQNEEVRRGKQLISSEEVFRYYCDKFKDLQKEMFMAILLDTKGRVLKEEVISIGCINANIVHPVNVYASAIRESASAVVFVHNHPSGDPEPSQEDLIVTARLWEVSKLIGIRLFDHIIIGEKGYTSMADDGWLDDAKKNT